MKKIIVNFLFFLAVGLTTSTAAHSNSLGNALGFALGSSVLSEVSDRPKRLIQMHDRYVRLGKCEEAFSYLANYDRGGKKHERVLYGEIFDQNMQRLEQSMYLRGLCMERRGKYKYAQRVYAVLLRINPDFQPMVYKAGDKEYFLSEIITRERLRWYTSLFYKTRRQLLGVY